MKTAVVCASIIGLLATVVQAQNENISWQTPMTITTSGTSDVNTQGIYFGSWAPHGSTLTVNGVTFQAFSDLPGLSSTFDNSTGPGSYASPNPLDANYNTLLTAGAFGNNDAPYSFNWDGMTPGDTYLVELWVNDGRNSTVNQRTETFTGGANTSAFLDYGSGNSGPGQFITSTFLADSSGAETITLTPGAAFPSPQLNLFEVRDITSVPEPSTLAMLGSGVLTLVYCIRRKA